MFSPLRNIGFETIWRPTWLSQMRVICATSPSLSSLSNCLSQINNLTKGRRHFQTKDLEVSNIT